MYLARVEAVESALQLIDELGIACGLERAPQLLVGRSDRDAQALRARAAVYAGLGLDVRWLTARELEARIGVPYCSALCFPQAATLDPSALTEGLARAIEQRGAAIFESTRVNTIQPGAPVQLRTEHAEIRAAQVVLATNAYPLGAAAKNAILSLEVHALCSAPLSQTQLTALGWRDRSAIVEWGLGAPYYRLTPDQCIVLGGGAGVDASADPRARAAGSARNWQLQERWLRSLHPALHGLAVAHRWYGRVAMTRDWLPMVGPHAPELGLHSAGGWCGTGVALALRSGRALAASVLAEPVSDASLPWWRSSAKAFGTGRLTRLTLRAGLALVARHAARTRGPSGDARKPQHATRDARAVPRNVWAEEPARAANQGGQRGIDR
jgi:glycine/D-amino acid oxidase-like deaminating enzyme